MHRRSVGILRSSGLPRRRTEEVLVVGRNALSRRYFLIGADVFEVPADFVIRVLFIGAFAYIVYLLIRWVIRQKR